jgi:excinuclease UvrABC nuclease subunit
VEWRSIGAKDDDFPRWVRNLKGKSGVYAIRKPGWFGATVVYVGESHTGGLYKTLTRHFQTWSRGKKFWRGAYAPEQTDPGHTYPRSDVEVAVQCAGKSEALDLQARWIERLKPRDNVLGPDEVPF